MAILKGLSEDGGLFVPTEIPKLDVPMDELAKMSYQETAYEVMKCFLTDFTEEELNSIIANETDKYFLVLNAKNIENKKTKKIYPENHEKFRKKTSPKVK